MYKHLTVCKQIISGSFKIKFSTNFSFKNNMCLIHLKTGFSFK